MNLLVPEHRILEPFRLRESQRGFDLRADIGFADAAIEIGHEYDGGKLLHQGPVFGFEIRELRVANRTLIEPFKKMMKAAKRPHNIFRIRAGESGENGFCFFWSERFLFGARSVGVARRTTAHSPD